MSFGYFGGAFIHVGAVVTAWASPSFFRVPTTGALLLLLGATLEAYSNLPFLSLDSILSPAKTRSAKLALKHKLCGLNKAIQCGLNKAKRVATR